MELFEYYKKKGKVKCLIGTGLFLYGLIGMYNTWGNINWGPVIFIIIVSFVVFGIGFWQLRKGDLLRENIVGNDLKFWNIDTYVLLELPEKNKHVGLYTPDGIYVAGTKMVSSTLPFLKNKQIFGLEASNGEILAYFHSEVENYDWAIYDSNYNRVGMFKENMIQGFGTVRGSLMNEKEIKLSEVEVEFDFFETSFRTMDNRILINCKRGYMPLEWSERFGLNVPIIKLGNNISNAEKIFGLGVLIYILETIKVRESRIFND
ncbi:ABC transporter ATP-binding protein [Bacillus cereus group sp. BfR-BA-01379]|uniref:ABC transporter ATP-binding protein n=1 Tax=Bacillus cereus group sp. BfR-BA-01379 TaxID=2920323 RepID=UPI001F595038|nr:ABC transporter ATP-binding protein [Bacillus cereus group sp. BfR-BA-01379]